MAYAKTVSLLVYTAMTEPLRLERVFKISHKSKEPAIHLQTKAKPRAGNYSGSNTCSLD